MRSTHPFLVAEIWLCFKWIMYEMFRKGKYKNKDKVSKLTPLSFFYLPFQNCCCVFCRRIINESVGGISHGSTKKKATEEIERPKKLRKMLYLSFRLFRSLQFLWVGRAATIMCWQCNLKWFLCLSYFDKLVRFHFSNSRPVFIHIQQPSPAY